MPKSRANGEGQLRKRPNGSWEARLMLPDGTRKSFYAKTRDEARRKLDRAKYERDRGALIAAGRDVTLSAFLEGWLEVKRGTRSYRTWVGYRQLASNHVIPALGRIRLNKLTATQVQQFYASKRATLSTTTVRHIHAMLHAALEHAMIQGLVLRNVCGLVEAPPVFRWQFTCGAARALFAVRSAIHIPQHGILRATHRRWTCATPDEGKTTDEDKTADYNKTAATTDEAPRPKLKGETRCALTHRNRVFAPEISIISCLLGSPIHDLSCDSPL